MNLKRTVSTIGLLWAIATLLVISGISPATAHEAEGLYISIPSISVEAPIVPVYIREFPNGDVTWDVSDLQMTVGHFEGLPAVGQGGNTVLGGHSERARGEADVFYNLHRVALGDAIFVTSDGVEFRYEVAQVSSVEPQDLSVLSQTSGEQLTLITCDLASFEEDGSYSRRVVVVAQRAD